MTIYPMMHIVSVIRFDRFSNCSILNSFQLKTTLKIAFLPIWKANNEIKRREDFQIYRIINDIPAIKMKIDMQPTVRFFKQNL